MHQAESKCRRSLQRPESLCNNAGNNIDAAHARYERFTYLNECGTDVDGEHAQMTDGAAFMDSAMQDKQQLRQSVTMGSHLSLEISQTYECRQACSQIRQGRKYSEQQ